MRAPVERDNTGIVDHLGEEHDLAFLFYSPMKGGAIHLAGLLLKDLFVDLRPGCGETGQSGRRVLGSPLRDIKADLGTTGVALFSSDLP